MMTMSYVRIVPVNTAVFSASTAKTRREQQCDCDVTINYQTNRIIS